MLPDRRRAGRFFRLKLNAGSPADSSRNRIVRNHCITAVRCRRVVGCATAIAEVQARFSYYGPRNKAGFNPVSDTQMYVYLQQNIDRRYF